MTSHKRLRPVQAGPGWAALILTLFLSQTAVSEPAAGTAGVAVQAKDSQWPGANTMMPKVFTTEDGHLIVMAQGREIQSPAETRGGINFSRFGGNFMIRGTDTSVAASSAANPLF